MLVDDYEVVTAGSAGDALARLRERRFDVVCADHNMPDMTGVELLDEVARRYPGTGCLLITGMTEIFEGREPSELRYGQEWD